MRPHLPGCGILSQRTNQEVKPQMTKVKEIGPGPADIRPNRRQHIRLALAAFLALSGFMYVSIIYKILKFGP